MTFAMMSTKTALAKLVLKYKISTPFKKMEDFKVKGGVVLKAANGYLVGIENREN